MKKVVLLCNLGMSTSMLVKRMREAAIEMSYECDINAYPVSEVTNVGKEADVILLGPQIRFKLNDIKKLCPNTPVEVIDTATYGMMDGKKVITNILKIIGE